MIDTIPTPEYVVFMSNRFIEPFCLWSRKSKNLGSLNAMQLLHVSTPAFTLLVLTSSFRSPVAKQKSFVIIVVSRCAVVGWGLIAWFCGFSLSTLFIVFDFWALIQAPKDNKDIRSFLWLLLTLERCSRSWHEVHSISVATHPLLCVLESINSFPQNNKFYFHLFLIFVLMGWFWALASVADTFEKIHCLFVVQTLQ